MGACSTRTKKIVKQIAAELTPIGVKMIGDIVGQLQTTNLDSATKRAAALAAVQASFKAAAITAKETAIRAGIEAAVTALKQGQDALAELGAAD